MSIGEVQRVLQNLLRENIPIRNLVTILETLGDFIQTVKDPDILTEYVRMALKFTISKKFTQQDKTMYAITIAPDLEQYLTQSLQKLEHGTNLVIEPGIAQAMYKKIAEQFGTQVSKGIAPVILCSPVVRMYLKRLIEKKFPDVDVISFNEIINGLTVENVGIIDLKSPNKQE